MAACGSLEHIFEKPLPDNPTLLESLSTWKQMKSINDHSSFTEIFGELHFKENNVPSSLSPSSRTSSLSSSCSTNSTDNPKIEKNHSPAYSYSPPSSNKKQYSHSDSFSSMNSESLSMCTEGLGFESSDDVEDVLSNDVCDYESNHKEEPKILTKSTTENHWSEFKRSKTCCRDAFPPPISCIGRSGKPWVCFKSYREDGRFILKEIRIPTQEFLQSCRENGRLKLRFILSESDDEFLEDDEEDEKEKNNETLCDDDKREHVEENKINGDENVKS